MDGCGKPLAHSVFERVTIPTELSRAVLMKIRKPEKERGTVRVTEFNVTGRNRKFTVGAPRLCPLVLLTKV